MQAYSNPSRENDPYTLPDIEVFYDEGTNFPYELLGKDEPVFLEPGWYWWSCFPGCLPDSDPIGPFDTETEALQDAQSG
jgi:hypothetical protein